MLPAALSRFRRGYGDWWCTRSRGCCSSLPDKRRCELIRKFCRKRCGYPSISPVASLDGAPLKSRSNVAALTILNAASMPRDIDILPFIGRRRCHRKLNTSLNRVSIPRERERASEPAVLVSRAKCANKRELHRSKNRNRGGSRLCVSLVGACNRRPNAYVALMALRGRGRITGRGKSS